MAWNARMARYGLATGLLIALAGPAAAQDADAPAAAKAEAPKADIYDEKADAEKLVADALAVAKRENKRVLLMFGGNWCGWCHKLHAVFKADAEIARTLSHEYVLVMIDTAAPKAEQVIARYEPGIRSGGVPYLTVLDADGKLVANQATGPLEEGDHHDPTKVLAFLEEQKAPPVDAQKAFDDALAEARSEGKKVFLHFGAPWCGWCHRLEAFLAREDMRDLLGAEFVDLKIDIDRTAEGKAILERYRGGEGGGIPWFAFLDGEGKALATSDGPGGNVGFPYAPEEIAHFLDMLKKTTSLTPDQIEAIGAALKPADKEAAR